MEKLHLPVVSDSIADKFANVLIEIFKICNYFIYD